MTRRSRSAVAAGAVVLATALAGCGGSDPAAAAEQLRGDVADAFDRADDALSWTESEVLSDGTEPESCPDGEQYRYEATGVTSEYDDTDADGQLDDVSQHLLGVAVPEGYERVETPVDSDDPEQRLLEWTSEATGTMTIELTVPAEGSVQATFRGVTACG